MIKNNILKNETAGSTMKVTTWNNGSFNASGAGYGIKIPKSSRDQYFNRNWDSVVLHIEDREVEVKLCDTFWTTCNELRSKEIGLFLIRNGLGDWVKGLPNEVSLTSVKDNTFKLSV